MIDDASDSRQCAGDFIVTGASSGLGFELARRLAGEGRGVVAIGRDPARLAEVSALSRNIETMQFDLARTGDIDALTDRLIASGRDIAGVINNAAVQHDLRLDATSYGAATIGEEIAINLTAPIVLTRALLPVLRRQRQATIVNISSALGFVPKSTAAVYSASKAGLHLFSEALRAQLRETSVRVIEVVPPLIDTRMAAGRGTGKMTPAQAAEAIVAAIERGANGAIFLGKARALPMLLRAAPGLAARMMLRS